VQKEIITMTLDEKSNSQSMLGKKHPAPFLNIQEKSLYDDVNVRGT
jgi:hypothetical protein